jgi:ribose transport system permease protein
MPQDSGKDRPSLREIFSFGGATGPLIGLILLCVFLSFATDSFLSMRNFLNILDQITDRDHRRRHDLRHPDRRDRPVGRIGARAFDDGSGLPHVEADLPMAARHLRRSLCPPAMCGVVSGLLVTVFMVPPSSRHSP